MPKVTSKKPRRSSPSKIRFSEYDGAIRSAAVATAMLAATDEEFAAGTYLSDPGSILSGSRTAPEGEPNKPPGRTTKSAKIAKSYTAAKKKAVASRQKIDPAKLKAKIKRFVKLQKNSELLASKPKKKG